MQGCGFGRIRPYLAILTAVAACAVLAAPASADSFVTRAGTQLLLDGHPYRFTGLNVYNANNAALCWYPMASGSTLGDSLAQFPQGSVIRVWFFQALATASGARDWSGFDHTLSVAAAQGVRVIATLGNQWEHCDGPDGGAGSYKDEAWYTGGYTQPDPAGTVSYRDWVSEVVDRYKDDPTILAWQLLNEAEVKPDVASADCSANAAQILYDFAADVSSVVKSIDSNHLVSLGTLGSGQCGSAGDDYYTLHAIPTIDLCEYHDYGSPLTPIPGDEWNGLQRRIDQCEDIGKPLVVGEMGIRATDVGGTAQDRADAFATKIQAPGRGGCRWHPRLGLERERVEARRLRHRAGRPDARRARREPAVHGGEGCHPRRRVASGRRGKPGRERALRRERLEQHGVGHRRGHARRGGDDPGRHDSVRPRRQLGDGPPVRRQPVRAV